MRRTEGCPRWRTFWTDQVVVDKVLLVQPQLTFDLFTDTVEIRDHCRFRLIAEISGTFGNMWSKNAHERHTVYSSGCYPKRLVSVNTANLSGLCRSSYCQLNVIQCGLQGKQRYFHEINQGSCYSFLAKNCHTKEKKRKLFLDLLGTFSFDKPPIVVTQLWAWLVVSRTHRDCAREYFSEYNMRSERVDLYFL